jgi:hypothetical protein
MMKVKIFEVLCLFAAIWPCILPLCCGQSPSDYLIGFTSFIDAAKSDCAWPEVTTGIGATLTYDDNRNGAYPDLSANYWLT